MRNTIYKCAAAKKKKTCDKKTVRKQWLEDLVVNHTIVNFQDCVDLLLLSFYRKFMFYICCIRYPVVPVCKSVQKCAEPKSAL